MKLEDLRSMRKQDEIAVVQKRFHCVSVRLNHDELIILDEYRGRSRRGEALRMLAFTNLPAPVPRLNAAAWQELARASANLNQLTHHLNGGGELRINEVREALEAFRMKLLGV